MAAIEMLPVCGKKWLLLPYSILIDGGSVVFKFLKELASNFVGY